LVLGPGTRIGPYEITAPIGETQAGAVYRATDTILGRRVAIKLLPNAFADDRATCPRSGSQNARGAEPSLHHGDLRLRRRLAVLVEKGDRLFFRSVSTAAGNRLRSVDIDTSSEFRLSNESLLNATGFKIVTYYRDYKSTSDGQNLRKVFPVADAKDDGVIHVVNWTELKRVAAKGQ
jgi:serine/threonine protein kinase